MHPFTACLFFALLCASVGAAKAEGASSGSEGGLPYKIISQGRESGTYQAFPDACRLKNGDILCVFYAGYTHVSLPNANYPNGGRICMVRSRDEGKTWSEPAVLYDDANDNRDPHIAQLRDGTLVCTFFSLKAKGTGYEPIGSQITRSFDGGKNWEQNVTPVISDWYCSAPMRELPNGTLLFPIYYEKDEAGQRNAWGGVLRSEDHGKTWSAPIPIGKGSGLDLAAETDIIRLKNGTLFAALRSDKVNMHYATSPDDGKTWTSVTDIGFKGHCPHLNRLKSGEILLSHRLPNTALHVSRDEGKNWEGPYLIDDVIGAYPSTVALKDGTALIVYYSEGKDSTIRAKRFRLKKDGIAFVSL